MLVLGFVVGLGYECCCFGYAVTLPFGCLSVCLGVWFFLGLGLGVFVCVLGVDCVSGCWLGFVWRRFACA